MCFFASALFELKLECCSLHLKRQVKIYAALAAELMLKMDQADFQVSFFQSTGDSDGKPAIGLCVLTKSSAGVVAVSS